MKKKLPGLIFFVMLFLVSDFCYSQNLISNGGFESYTVLPVAISDISMVNNWTSATAATPDYFNIYATATDVQIPNNYFGIQPAHYGTAYCGLITYSTNPAYSGYEYREYLQQHLNSPLHSGTKYYFEFYVSRVGGNLQHYATDKMGIYFSSDAISASAALHINVTPDFEFPNAITDSVNWTKISGCYTAGDNIQYVTLGNFRDNNSLNALPVLPVWPAGITRSYYYIDDVSLTELKVDFDFDNAFCNADVAFTNQSTFDANCVWTFDDGTSDTSTNPVHHYEKPGSYNVKLVTTSVTQCTDSLIRTVEIKSLNHHLYIPNAFTPNGDGLNDFFEIKQAEYCEPIRCSIYNRWGQKIFEQCAFEIKWNGQFNAQDAAQGIYFYVVEKGSQKYSANLAVIR